MQLKLLENASHLQLKIIIIKKKNSKNLIRYNMQLKLIENALHLQ